MATSYTQAEFVELLEAEFPDLLAEIGECDGLLHLQMGVFAQRVQQAKGSGDWYTYAKGASLADSLWRRATPELRNALLVSFLERLDFQGERGAEAWRQLSPPLRDAWTKLHDANASSVANRSHKRR